MPPENEGRFGSKAIMLRSSWVTVGATNAYVLAGAVFLTETYLDDVALAGCVPVSCVFVFAMSVLLFTFTFQALATLVLYQLRYRSEP